MLNGVLPSKTVRIKESPTKKSPSYGSVSVYGDVEESIKWLDTKTGKLVLANNHSKTSNGVRRKADKEEIVPEQLALGMSASYNCHPISTKCRKRILSSFVLFSTTTALVIHQDQGPRIGLMSWSMLFMFNEFCTKKLD